MFGAKLEGALNRSGNRLVMTGNCGAPWHYDRELHYDCMKGFPSPDPFAL